MKLGLAEALCARLHGRLAEDDDRLRAQTTLTHACAQAGRFAEAEPLYRDLLATRRRVVAQTTWRHSWSPGTWAAYSRNRDPPERQRAALGPEHEDTLRTAGNFAGALQNQGKFSEAELLVRDTLAIQQRVLGEEHLDTLLTAGILTSLLTNTSQHAAAEALCRGTLAQAIRTLGPDDPTSLGLAFAIAAALGN